MINAVKKKYERQESPISKESTLVQQQPEKGHGPLSKAQSKEDKKPGIQKCEQVTTIKPRRGDTSGHVKTYDMELATACL